MEEMGLGKDFDYSERFISILSETTHIGNSPTRVAETIRQYGLIPQAMLPFDESITSWEDFNSWKGADKEKCLIAGQQWKKRYGFAYDLAWKGDISPEEKHKILEEISKFCPPPVSVLAWVSNNGEYFKPMGGDDNHLTLRAKANVAFDTYEPYLKNLRPLYDHAMALRVVVTKKKYETPVGFWKSILSLIKKLWQ
jgi:hypothetical protein